MPLDCKSLITKHPPYKSICTWSLTELYSSLWKWSNMVHLFILNTILFNSQRPQYLLWNKKWDAGGESIFVTQVMQSSCLRQLPSIRTCACGPFKTQTLVIYFWHDNINEWLPVWVGIKKDKILISFERKHTYLLRDINNASNCRWIPVQGSKVIQNRETWETKAKSQTMGLRFKTWILC